MFATLPGAVVATEKSVNTSAWQRCTTKKGNVQDIRRQGPTDENLDGHTRRYGRIFKSSLFQLNCFANYSEDPNADRNRVSRKLVLMTK